MIISEYPFIVIHHSILKFSIFFVASKQHRTDVTGIFNKCSGRCLGMEHGNSACLPWNLQWRTSCQNIKYSILQIPNIIFWTPLQNCISAPLALLFRSSSGIGWNHYLIKREKSDFHPHFFQAKATILPSSH